jgi:aminomethyltransferase
MPIPTPFHPRTSALCTSLFWKEWAGCHAVRSYDTHHEREYHAIRQAAGLIDVSPLYKYEVRGAGAADFLSHLTVRDVRRLRPGRVTYLCWCDDDGKVVDDGTVSRLAEDHFRLTSAEPALAWLLRHARAFRVEIEDASARLGALALQGPRSRAILEQAAAMPLGGLRFFGVTAARIEGIDVQLSRTGYTGDLGFEIWVPREHALAVWDALVRAGQAHRLLPAGLDALDVTRIEAGFILNGVDYFSAPRCLIASRKSTPDEIGLGWTVALEREPFVGQSALRAERRRGPAWAKVGLRYDWEEYEALFAEVSLPPQVPSGAWRTAVPLYDSRGRQVGQATSGAWSPLLKCNLALATVESGVAAAGTRLRVEVTVEYRRKLVTATVEPTPFFDPPRKRA